MCEMTLERLKSRLTYDPVTGFFTWLPRSGESKSVKMWNGQYAGKVATGKDKNGYGRIFIEDTHYYCHRLAFLYMTGELPPNHVDHINGIPSDCRWSNLRLVDRTGNMRNAKLSRRNTSGVAGVFWHKGQQRWIARIKASEQIHLGSYTTLLDAAAARRSAERRLGFHPNHGRCRIPAAHPQGEGE